MNGPTEKWHASDQAFWTEFARSQPDSTLQAGTFGDALGIQGRFFERLYRLIHCEAWESVLDFGCGTAPYRNYFRPGRYVGLEINPTVFEFARTRWPDTEFVLHDGLPLPFPDGYFDLIVSLGVLQHNTFDEQEGIARDFRRVIRDGGRLILWEDTEDVRPHVWGRDGTGWEDFLRGARFNPIWRWQDQHMARAV